ncbi:hypothetical protein [Neisseria leonii]|uniref:hypothetical protein n=1 Tax=Neisseria leonii TaxID=2995413 RepID=UPI00237B2099|nr:hypothetical protein [Neisseria sp. 3986]MDD9326023.1 hypothetical protein [Neisseria sp. 3986]
MKKFILLLLVPLLAACSAIDVKRFDEAALAEVKQICVRDTYGNRMPHLAQELAASFQRAGVSAEIQSVQEGLSDCRYLLNGKVKGGGDGRIKRSKFTIVENTGERRRPLTTVVYYTRNEEKQLAQEQGLTGQTDRIVQLLLGQAQE